MAALINKIIFFLCQSISGAHLLRLHNTAVQNMHVPVVHK